MFIKARQPLKVLRMLFALATSKGLHRQKVCGIWDVSVAFFHSPMDEFTVVRPPVGLRVRGRLWVLKRALYGTRMASRCFGKLVGEVLKTLSLKQSPLSQTRIIILRETLTLLCTETTLLLLRRMIT